MSSQLASLGIDRVLLVKRPWSDLIVDGQKLWEMRSRRTHFRGVFGIAESGTGLIVGKATLVDCLDALSDEEYFDHFAKHRISAQHGEALHWRFPWVIAGATRLPIPAPYSHRQGAVIWVRL